MTKTQVEVITSVQRRRRWLRSEKERIVAAAMEPGAVASEVARAAGIYPSQLFRWRQQLCAVAPGAPVFSPVAVVPGAGGPPNGHAARHEWLGSAGPGGTAARSPCRLPRASAARAGDRARPDGLSVLRRQAPVQAGRGRHRDAGGDPAPVEGDPACAREVHLPGLREDQPRTGAVPLRSPGAGRVPVFWR